MSEFENSEQPGKEEQPEKYESKHFKLAVAHEEMNSRRRNTMEDCHRILPILDERLPNYAYIGVYDGHGGRQIVDFLEPSLEKIVAEEFLLDNDASPEERIKRYF
jgi:serine/threonine protein phosphatase PrpC